jgi:hypothetical protein
LFRLESYAKILGQIKVAMNTTRKVLIVPDTKVALVAVASKESAYLADWVFHHLRFGFDPIVVLVCFRHRYSLISITFALSGLTGVVPFRPEWLRLSF